MLLIRGDTSCQKPSQSVLWPIRCFPLNCIVFTAPMALASGERLSKNGMILSLYGIVTFNPCISLDSMRGMKSAISAISKASYFALIPLDLNLWEK